MAASLKQDYAKILRAGAELIMVSPDSVEQHREYGLKLFGEELPYIFVSDNNLEIARRYGLIREEEHHHGGFYYRSLWILESNCLIVHKSVPWTGNETIAEYQKLFSLIGAEGGEWKPTCGLQPAASQASDESR